MSLQQDDHPSSADSDQAMPFMASSNGRYFPQDGDDDDDDGRGGGNDNNNAHEETCNDNPPRNSTNFLRIRHPATPSPTTPPPQGLDLSFSSGAWTRQLFNPEISNFGMTDVYVRVVQVYWYSRHARFMIALAAASLVPATVILMLAVNRIVQVFFTTTDVTDPKFIHKNFLGILLIIMIRLLLNQGVCVLSDGAICYVSADVCLGRGVGASQRWPAALKVAMFRKALLLIVAGTICFLAIFVGYCFFFVAGVYVVVTLYLTVPALVLEPDLVWPWDGLARSFELTYDRPVFLLWCHTLLIAVQSLLAYLIHALVDLIFRGVTAGGIGSMFSVSGTFWSMLPSILLAPVYPILKTILYIRARVELEGMTPEQLAENMGHGRQLLQQTSSSSSSPGEGVGYQQVALQEEEACVGSLATIETATTNVTLPAMAFIEPSPYPMEQEQQQQQHMYQELSVLHEGDEKEHHSSPGGLNHHDHAEGGGVVDLSTLSDSTDPLSSFSLEPNHDLPA